jgi:hypothetical protein
MRFKSKKNRQQGLSAFHSKNPQHTFKLKRLHHVFYSYCENNLCFFNKKARNFDKLS